MTYAETLDYLYNKLPMFTRIGAAAYKKDLHNTLALLTALGDPHKQFKSIHIAGTNGKGSTSHMLAAVLHAAGYKVGLYTSPHLRDFRERIKISGSTDEPLQMIPQSFVVEFTAANKALTESIEPSFFELTVAMAFDFFAKEKVDVAIVETGLGGRLDSTNVVMPELSIITNIGWDHMNILGDTLPAIAAEKAGIIKPGIPVVIGETLPETTAVFANKAASVSAPIIYAENELFIQDHLLEIDKLTVQYTDGDNEMEYATDLTGLYQQKNLRTVLCAVQELFNKGWRISDAQLRHGLLHVKARTGLHGRWEVIRQNPYLVLDVGHNEDGIKQILQQLQAVQQPGAMVRMVMGMVKDKEVEKVLQLLPKVYQYYFTNAHLPRAMPATELTGRAAALELEGRAFDDVTGATRQALRDSSAGDIVVVCGSVFVVGELDQDLLD